MLPAHLPHHRPPLFPPSPNAPKCSWHVVTPHTNKMTWYIAITGFANSGMKTWGGAGEAQWVRVLLSFRQTRGAAVIKTCLFYFFSYGSIFPRCFFFLFSSAAIKPPSSYRLLLHLHRPHSAACCEHMFVLLGRWLPVSHTQFNLPLPWGRRDLYAF